VFFFCFIFAARNIPYLIKKFFDMKYISFLVGGKYQYVLLSSIATVFQASTTSVTMNMINGTHKLLLTGTDLGTGVESAQAIQAAMFKAASTGWTNADMPVVLPGGSAITSVTVATL